MPSQRDPSPTETLGLVTVETYPCPVCHIATRFTFASDQYHNWLSGADPVEAFDNIDHIEAWLFITGIHPVCWESFRLDDPRLRR